MNPAKILAAALTITASLALTPDTAAATPGTCKVTFQPQNEYSYHAAYQAADGTVTVLIAQQTEAIHLPPTSFDIPADALRVLWATRPELAPADPSNPDNYFPKTPKDNGSSLWLGPDCTFTTPYTSAPNWRPSVVIDRGAPPVTTTQPAPTTSAPPEQPPSEVPDTPEQPPIEVVRDTPAPAPEPPAAPPSSTTSEVTTTTTEIVVDVPLVEQPTTTTAPTPQVPSSSTAVEVDLYTATSVERQAGTLPVTGANLRQALTLAACLVALGGVLAAVFTPHRRRLARERAQ